MLDSDVKQSDYMYIYNYDYIIYIYIVIFRNMYLDCIFLYTMRGTGPLQAERRLETSDHVSLNPT